MRAQKIVLFVVISIIFFACSTSKNTVAKELKEEHYDKVSPVAEGPEYKLLQKGYHYGFYEQGKGIILPVEYFLKGVSYDGSALFTLDEPFYARRKGKWGQVHMNGIVAMDFKYDYLLSDPENEHYFYYQEGKTIGVNKYEEPTAITTNYKYLMAVVLYDSKSTLVVSNDGKTVVYLNPENGEVITVDKNKLKNSFTIVHVNGKFGLYDDGEQIYLGEPIYDLVQHSNGAFSFWEKGEVTKTIGMEAIWKE